jgi:hypothetical protein
MRGADRCKADKPGSLPGFRSPSRDGNQREVALTIHFHVGRIPFTFQITRGESARELEEKTTVLIWYALSFPLEGQRARYVLRRWAGGPGPGGRG